MEHLLRLNSESTGFPYQSIYLALPDLDTYFNALR